MVEPQLFGLGSGAAVGAASASVQRKLRKMSRHPEEPRVFSQAKIFLPFGLLISLVMTPVMYFQIRDYVQDQTDDIFSIIVPGVAALMGYLFVAHGLFRRFGVDRDKIWTRFSKLFYREVQFDQLDRFDTGVHRYKLYANATLVNLDYNRFDYTLAYIRLLEELQYRRFELQGVGIDDPDWDETAQGFRNSFASKAYHNHRAFYDAHPKELDRLNALVQPPTSYIN